MNPLSFLLVLSQLVFHVHAHGFVHQVIIDGRAYLGNVPDTETPVSPSVIRHVDDQGPVKGATNKDVNCGLNAQKAQLVANANPGSVIEFNWTEYNLALWPHNTGPMLTYMTNCGSVTCDQYDSSNSGWFKIEQVGKKDDSNWYQADIAAGKTAVVTIPSNIAPGNYIIRHEIIALHLGQSEGGAEFYPSCAQLKIGGNGNGAPDPDELVLLPGAYKDTDPGIWDKDVYNPGDPYNEDKMPGPPVAKFVQQASGGSGNTGTGTGSSSSSSTPGSSSGSGTSTAGGSQPTSTSQPKCSLRRSMTTTATLTRRSLANHRRRHNMWDMLKISMSALR